MNRTLYKKFILAYVIFGIAGFVFLSTVGSRVIEQYLIESCSSSLTREARSIASRQASLYYKEERTLQSLYNTLSALSSFHDAQIWLISPDGEILLNTEEPLDTETYKTIQGFDPVELGSNYYSTGDFLGSLTQKCSLSWFPSPPTIPSTGMLPSTGRSPISTMNGSPCSCGST